MGVRTMTDNETIKALECCVSDSSCFGCPAYIRTVNGEVDCNGIDWTLVLDIIKRQKAEISVKNKLLKKAEKLIETERAEAIKEVTEIIVSDYSEMEYYLDNLRKEMVGEG
jgi:hypothetical protein